MIDIEMARELLDFSKRIGKGQRADEQLEGAVAVHNILETHGIAYLADEVGMGKTYVALGALALFRHLNPAFRVLVIAPRENIQRKWMKEQGNFVKNNYLVSDLRVKGLDQRPARRMVFCDSLLDLVRETALDPHRDFFARMTSFSLAVTGRGALTIEDVRGLRDGLRAHLPWIRDEVFDLRSKQAFKDNFAAALCCALPTFDLVIIDEAHNLKHGFSASSAARNRVLALALGRDPSTIDTRLFPGYAARAKRILLLSATPVEESYIHLWNQLDVFGAGGRFGGLRRDDLSDDEKKKIAGEFLVRRVTTIKVAGENLTKNLYRREWRSGGVETFDDPISVTDPRQRLTVALVQKKVSELLGSERFNSSFQIGMLASFESFLETTKVKRLDDDSPFDDPTQTESTAEREGIDVLDVNRISRAYRRKFGTEMPHPKMDALVDSLDGAWKRGEKALAFVRRVASVKELKRKLDERYDRWLLERLRRDLPEAVSGRFEALVRQYQADKQSALEAERDLDRPRDEDADQGGADTFFAWFFRGQGPAKVLSGANIQQRFIQRGTTLATFFEDNYAAYVLSCSPADVEERLANALALERQQLRQELRRRSLRFLPRVKKLARADRFEAVQAAAIELLKDTVGAHRDRARIIWEERFVSAGSLPHATEAPEIGDWLGLRTFFTELPNRPELRTALWLAPDASDPREAFRERELRRQLLAGAARLGHSFIDFYVMTIRRLGSLDLRTQESQEDDTANTESSAIEQYLDLLDQQRLTPRSQRDWAGYDELADVGANFPLILDTNVPDARDMPLREIGKLFGRLLRQQQPVGGMAGQINQTLVRQFRMPGYPFILITTDLLQEGEDLHTFCSTVHHYGISWTPSAMEQRIGRIDRVRSQTDRRLSALPRAPDGQEKLQVLFPHLQDTVEVLQVRRVLERMDAFLRLMHEGLITAGREDSRIIPAVEFERNTRPAGPQTQPLRSSFPVRPEHLIGEGSDVAAVVGEVDGLAERFVGLCNVTVPGIPITWESSVPPGALMGTAHLPTRIQPFAVFLDLYGMRPRIRCVSPVGRVRPFDQQDNVVASAWGLDARLGAILGEESGSYDLTVEEDVLLAADPASDNARFVSLLRRVVDQADHLEQEYLVELDQPITVFRDDLQLELGNGR